MAEAFDVRVSRAYTAMLDVFERAPAKVLDELKASNAAFIEKRWPAELSEQPQTLAQSKVLVDGADTRALYAGVVLRAATSGAKLSGGLNTGLGRKWAGFEFGATEQTVMVRREGTMRAQAINRQFVPRRSKGKIVYPTARRLGPKMIQNWVNAVIKGIGQGNTDIKTR